MQEIRDVLVDSQVKLSEYHDGGLYLIIELIAEGVRQFITYEESIKDDQLSKDMYRPPEILEKILCSPKTPTLSHS